LLGLPTFEEIEALLGLPKFMKIRFLGLPTLEENIVRTTHLGK